MSQAESVTLSRYELQWFPVRYPVRWADSLEEIPVWDASRQPYPPAQGINGEVSLEAFEALPPAQRTRATRGATRRYAHTATPTDILTVPRLVMVWPGRSLTLCPEIGDGSPKSRGVTLSPQAWLKRVSSDKIHREVLSLSRWLERPSKTRRMSEGQLKAKFRAGGLELVHKYSLLDPQNGDSLLQWVSFVLEVAHVKAVFDALTPLPGKPRPALSETDLEEIGEKVESRLDPKWLQDLEEHDTKLRVRIMSGEPVPRGARELRRPLSNWLSFPVPPGETRSPIPGEALFAQLGQNLLERGMSGPVFARSDGVWLRTGLLGWVRLELSRVAIGAAPRCLECGLPLVGLRRHAQRHPHCSNQKRQANSRTKKKAARE